MSEKRSEIEQAATRAIKRGGLGSVSFRTLAEQVGVKSSSVHYHFKTKDDLAEAVIRSYTRAFEEALVSIDRGEVTLLGKLDAFNGLFADVVRQNDICLCGMMAAEVSSLGEEAQAALRQFFELSETWLEQVLTAHAEEIRSELTPAQLAAIFISGLEGATLVDRVANRDDHLAAFRALSRTLLA